LNQLLKQALGVLLLFLIVYGLALAVTGGEFVDAFKVCGWIVGAFAVVAVLVGLIALAVWLLEG
jgi:hypothetical protein